MKNDILARLPVRCHQCAGHKLLARINTSGLYLWCRDCHGEQLILWSDIFTTRAELDALIAALQRIAASMSA